MDYAGVEIPINQQNGRSSSSNDVAVMVAKELAGAIAQDDVHSENRGKIPVATDHSQPRRLGLPHSAASALCLAKMRAQSPPRSSSDDSLLRHVVDGEPSVECGGAGPSEAAKCGSRVAHGPGEERSVADSQSVEYETWQAQHPSALQHFEPLVAAVAGRQVALFLDYDGTLSPIVEDPDAAFMSDAMREAVREAGSLFPTAIISGRGREKVFEFVRLPELFYAGSHGMDIQVPAAAGASASASANDTAAASAPGGPLEEAPAAERPPAPGGSRSAQGEDATVMLCQPASAFLPVMREVFQRLEERAAAIPGALVENNKFCVTVHFRRVPEQFWEDLAEAVVEEVKGFPMLRTSHGRKVLEVRPILDWDKGKAVAYLLQALGLGDSATTVPLYIGDDRTDEDAFKILNERGSGFGIIVSSSAKSTLATYSLKDPAEVMAFLHRLVEWRRRSL